MSNLRQHIWIETTIISSTEGGGFLKADFCLSVSLLVSKITQKDMSLFYLNIQKTLIIGWGMDNTLGWSSRCWKDFGFQLSEERRSVQKAHSCYVALLLCACLAEVCAPHMLLYLCLYSRSMTLIRLCFSALYCKRAYFNGITAFSSLNQTV